MKWGNHALAGLGFKLKNACTRLNQFFLCFCSSKVQLKYDAHSIWHANETIFIFKVNELFVQVLTVNLIPFRHYQFISAHFSLDKKKTLSWYKIRQQLSDGNSHALYLPNFELNNLNLFFWYGNSFLSLICSKL